MSKIDPKKLSKLDRRSTLLLQASRPESDPEDEKGLVKIEDPGMDTLRGSFGTVGSIIRARTVKRMSQSSRLSRSGPPTSWDPHHSEQLSGMKRHQLYDAPVPRLGGDNDSIHGASVHSLTPKRPTIKFDNQDLVHSYNRPGTGDNTARHEHRQALASPASNSGYPPLPPIPTTSGSLLDISSPPQIYQSPPDSNLAGLGAGGGDTSGMVGSTTAVGSVSEYDDKDLRDSSLDSQLLAYPPLFKDEHRVHSAPPTVLYDKYRVQAGQKPARKDSRDIFQERTPSTVRGTLLSFPSVTDSARSQDWDEEELEREKQVKQQKSLSTTSRDKSKERKSPGKRYPKGADEADMEESESLWRKSLENESEEGSQETHGVRLVIPKRK